MKEKPRIFVFFLSIFKYKSKEKLEVSIGTFTPAKSSGGEIAGEGNRLIK